MGWLIEVTEKTEQMENRLKGQPDKKQTIDIPKEPSTQKIDTPINKETVTPNTTIDKPKVKKVSSTKTISSYNPLEMYVDKEFGDIEDPYQELDAKMFNGALIGLHGQQKHGKTDTALSLIDFALKYPSGLGYLRPAKPIYWIDTQLGLERALPRYMRFAQKHQINLKEFIRPIRIGDISNEKFGADNDKFVRKVDEAIYFACRKINTENSGSIVIDSWSKYEDALKNIVYAHYKVDPGAESIPRKYWTSRNDKIEHMLRKLKQTCLCIIIGHDSEKWTDAKGTATGIFNPEWHWLVPYWASMIVKQYKDDLGARYLRIVDSGFGDPEDDNDNITIGHATNTITVLLEKFKSHFEILGAL